MPAEVMTTGDLVAADDVGPVNDQAAVLRAETELLTSTLRCDADRVGALLAPDFVEIGRSGRRWTRAEVIAALADEPPREAPVIDQWECRQLSAGLMLATYVLHERGQDSYHSSIWEVGTHQPTCRFHHGDAAKR